jgi:hypothetical protein
MMGERTPMKTRGDVNEYGEPKLKSAADTVRKAEGRKCTTVHRG